MDKQIEEMTNIMFEYALAIDGFSPEIKKAMEEVSTKQAIKKALWGYAKALYDAGYRKIPEGAVVLTGTETEERLEDLLIEFDEMSFYPATLMPNAEECAREWKLKLIYAIGQLRKETAQKFAELKTVWKQRAKEYTDWAGNKVQAVTLDWLFADIDEICKEIIGEV